MPCDYKDYAPDWKTRIRPAILERSTHTLFESATAKCEQCGKADRSFGENGKQIVVTVAHRDQNKANNLFSEKPWEIDDTSKNNLLALCQKHHFELDRKYNLEKAKKTRQAGNFARGQKNDEKQDEKTEKSASRGNARKSAAPSRSKSEKTVGVNSTKKRKIKKKQRKVRLEGTPGNQPFPLDAAVEKKEDITEKEKLSKLDLEDVPSWRDEKKERKRRNKEKREAVKKYRAKEGLEVKREKVKVNLPYHQKVWMGSPLLRYTAAGITYGKDGKGLSREEESQIWGGLVDGNEGKGTGQED
jgi:hypothetical protein